ncbi:hypothetical protein AB0M46_41220 [Dactylosporangium sp. NPDC051485]|uniref:hypothetical protein n=1 Tax=Dactylosporangium sp. NPDC051485 TaxID=3154846 RepID=UPI0034243705
MASFARMLEWADTLDIDTLDLNTATCQYRAATVGEYTTHTRNTYVANARRAITVFLDWVDSGFDWQAVNVGRAAERTPTIAEEWYRFPLRTDIVITLRLPTDLTTAEAARLTAFITALPTHHDDAGEPTPSNG